MAAEDQIVVGVESGLSGAQLQSPFYLNSSLEEILDALSGNANEVEKIFGKPDTNWDVESPPLSESIQVEPSLPSASSSSLQRELDTLSGNANEAENFTIFRTPHSISQSKKNLFEPSVISIGPFHRGQKNLRALEEQKRRFLRDFLSRKDHISLNDCISQMKLLEKRTRRCYSETFDDLDSHSFVEMMLLDGCFLLEFFLKLFEERNLDSILEVGWNCKFIKRDLLLQENQIPFFIVDKLQELIGINQECRMFFVKYLALYLLPKDYITPDTIPPFEIPNPPDEIPDSPHSLHPRSEIPNLPAQFPDRGVAAMPDNLAQIPEIPDPLAEIRDSLAKIADPPAEIHHLVHLYYHYLVPNPEKPVVLISKSFDLTRMFSANRITKGLLHRFRSRVLRGRPPHSTSGRSFVPLPDGTGNLSSMVIPSATELKEAGLKFTPKCNPKHMLDISFEYGVLKIPRLKITDFTKPIFTNLLAFEQSKYGKENLPFGRFLSFLDNLVNTPNDVKILQECGIIENWLGSEEELANFINQVTEGNFLESNHYLVELYTEVNRYAESSWHRNRAKLIRDYFSSPWATMSVIAAFILLVLTLVQSFFAVFAYFRPPSS